MRGSDILVHLTDAPQELQSYHINEHNESERDSAEFDIQMIQAFAAFVSRMD